ncbi:MAG: DUF4097 family beta strand repeat protein [Candidatus Hydrogenedentes bacterium]|nr:DUF4097 family beta strand repeat protein [Candidatus Hydrogenedentota bacterium]MBI3118377.1 DUF4097 family beta strand repeat protein [Candidatus Hydrogenedentota bacterium]
MNTVLKSLATAVLIATAVQIFTVGVLAPALPRQVCRPRVEMIKQFSLAAAPELHITNADGAVSVATGKPGAVDLTVEVRAYTGEEYGEIASKYVDTLFKVTPGAEVITVLTEPSFRPDEVELAADYSVTVPPDTRVVVGGANGNVTVGQGCGSIRITGNNRDIKIEQPSGPVDIDITNGRIQVYDAVGETVLKTINGKVYAYMRGGTLDASTTNGSIVVSVLSEDVKSCNLKSMNGGITLVAPEACSAQIEAVTGRGVVKSDFDVRPLLGRQRQRQLRGIIGSGATRLSMNSLNGNIWLAKE